MTAAMATRRRTQAERSAAMQERLVDAAIASLLDHGYAHTTAVEVCRRAGVTRGAFHHHFESIAALLIAALEQLYVRIGRRARHPRPASLEAFVRAGWQRVRVREFKAVIEIWLAARNDPDLGRDLGPAIARLSPLFDPEQNAELARIVGADPRARALYRLASETMIGLALGRASSPANAAVAHERDVIELLAEFAREHDARHPHPIPETEE